MGPVALRRYGATLPSVPHVPSLWRGGTHPLPAAHQLIVRHPVALSRFNASPFAAGAGAGYHYGPTGDYGYRHRAAADGIGRAERHDVVVNLRTIPGRCGG